MQLVKYWPKSDREQLQQYRVKGVDNETFSN